MSSALDAGELDDDRQLGGLVGAEAVDLRAEAAAQAREARHLPEVGEQLLDLAREAVDVAPAGHADRTGRSTERRRRVSLWRASWRASGSSSGSSPGLWPSSRTSGWRPCALLPEVEAAQVAIRRRSRRPAAVAHLVRGATGGRLEAG